MSCGNYILLNQCFYIQTCECTTTNCCDTCVNGNIIYLLNFNGLNKYTDTYYVNYYIVDNLNPPKPIPGVANKILNNHYEAIFDDQTKFQIYFSNDSCNIGKCNVITSSIIDHFCIININLYQNNTKVC